jgi:hypothetical protein
VTLLFNLIEVFWRRFRRPGRFSFRAFPVLKGGLSKTEIGRVTG